MFKDIFFNHYTYCFLVSAFLSQSGIAQTLEPEEIFEIVNPSVLQVYAYDFDGIEVAQGSGAIIDKGVVITNFHIYSGNENLRVTHYGVDIKIRKVLGVDVGKDILILQIDTDSLPALKISDLSNLKIGNKVYAIGSPKGYENSITDGLISGKRIIDGSRLFQISAPIYPGSSGGAVVDTKGELIGISSSKIPQTEINFAIPIDVINNLSSNCSLDDTVCSNKLEKFVIAYNAFISKRYEVAYKNIIDYLNIDDAIFIYPEIKKAFYTIVGEVIINYELKDSQLNSLLSIRYWDKDFYHSLKGLVNYKNGKFTRAIKEFITATKIDSTTADYYYYLGLCYDELNSEKTKNFFFKKAFYLGKTELGYYLWQKGLISIEQLR